jgi:hypothetical protein
MQRIDKFVGNIQDKYSSKCVIKDFDFHFDTEANNLDFAYYCLRYHLNYIINTYEGDDTVKIGTNFGFHYHLEDRNEWWYTEIGIKSDLKEFPLEDFLDNKIQVKISMSSSILVTDKQDIAILNLGFGVKN